VFYPPQIGWCCWVADISQLQAWQGSTWIEISQSNIIEADQVGVNAIADTTNRLSLNAPASLFNHEGNGHQIKINKNQASDTASTLYQTGFSGRAEVGLTGDDNFHFKVSEDGSNFFDALNIFSNGNVQFNRNCEVKTNFTKWLALSVNNTNVDPVTCSLNLRVQNVNRGVFTVNHAIQQCYINCTDETGAWKGAQFRIQLPTSASANTDSQLFLKNDGNVGCGLNNPTAKLHVNGAIRSASYTVATLPSASANGAGSVIYVSDEAGGAVIAFSDGTDWRRCTDRAIVS